MIRLPLAFTLILLAMPATGAAQITVQQPAVQVFQTNGSVFVPDRGSTALGGFSSARDGRIQRGFLPWGSAAGWERSHASASAHVSIHDLEAMDRALLAAPVPAMPPAPPLENPLAERACQSLLERHRALQHRPMTPLR